MSQQLQIILTLSFTLASVGLLLLLMLYRVHARRVVRRSNELRERFRQVLMNVITGAEVAPLTLRDPLELEIFVSLFIHFILNLRGPVREILVVYARALTPPAGLLSQLDDSDAKHINLLMMLGLLKYDPAWNRIAGFLASVHPITSMIAMDALIRINHRDAMPLLFKHLAGRADWPLTQIADFFVRQPDYYREFLVQLPTYDPAHQGKLLPLLDFFKAGERLDDVVDGTGAYLLKARAYGS